MKKKFWITVLVLCAVSALTGFSVGKILFDSRIDKEESVQEEETAVKAANTEQKITPSTKMVYEYYYPEDDVTEVYEDVPPYFLIDYTFDDIKRCYSNWTIVSFSDREVIMKKNVDGPSSQRYIIGEKDGYIAVYYDIENEGYMLKEITTMPVSALSDEDRRCIESGIRITGKEKLVRALEDYTS